MKCECTKESLKKTSGVYDLRMIMASCTTTKELKVESLLLQGQKLMGDELASC